MSMRRSRIKPAINLAASRRSTANSKPSGSTATATKRGLTPPKAKVTPKKKDPEEGRQKPPSGKETLLVDKKNEEKSKRTHTVETTASNESATSNLAKDNHVTKAKQGTKAGSVAVAGVENTIEKNIDDKTREDDIICTATTTKSTEETNGSNISEEPILATNPVRRKRISATPNIGQRRHAVAAGKGGPSSRPKQAENKKDPKVVLAISSGSEEKGEKDDAIKNMEDSEKHSSESKENAEAAKLAEPPAIQRKIHRQAPIVTQPHEKRKEKVTEVTKPPDGPIRKEPLIPDPLPEETNSDLVPGPPADLEGEKSSNIYKNRLDEMKEYKTEEAPYHKRRSYRRRPKVEIDPSKMRMRDLIYFNPKENKMSSKLNNSMEKKIERSKQSSVKSIPRNHSDNDADMEDGSTPEATPQVKIGPDGNIILDQQSLVKVVTPKRKLDESEIMEVKEDSSTTTYSSFKKSKYTAVWTKAETEKFYMALSRVGTDFSMINTIFPHRRRRELKNKFKREEKTNAARMEKAFRETRTFDFSDFKNMDLPKDNDKTTAVNGEDEAVNGETFKRPGKRRKKRKNDKSEDTYVVPNSYKPSGIKANTNLDASMEERTTTTPTPSAVETPVSTLPEPATLEGNDKIAMKVLQNLHDPFGTVPTVLLSNNSEVDNSSDEEEQYDMESILGKPTRSGRQPKQREVFTIQDALSQPRSVRPTSENDKTRAKTGKHKSKHKKKQGMTHTRTVKEPEIIQEKPRVPPLHPEYIPKDSPVPGVNTPFSSHVIPQNNHNPRESPSYRTEHYLVTYPNGKQAVVQMPVPAEPDNEFDFVLNIVPSPVREGGVLQLGIVPRQSSSNNSSPQTPRQPMDRSLGLLSPRTNQGLPMGGLTYNQELSSNITPGSSTQLKSKLDLHRSGSPGPSHRNTPGRSIVHCTGSVGSISQSLSRNLSSPHSIGSSQLSVRSVAGDTAGQSSGTPLRKVLSTFRSPSSTIDKSCNHASSEIRPGSMVLDAATSSKAPPAPYTGVRKPMCTIADNSRMNKISSAFETGIIPPVQIFSLQAPSSIASSSKDINSSPLLESCSSAFKLSVSDHSMNGVIGNKASEQGIVVGINQQATGNIKSSVSGVDSEVMYVTDLADLMPVGFEASDLNIAQQVDVSSSVQLDDVGSDENEAFVPI